MVAIAGGSGAGKTWLAERLTQHLGPDCAVVTLDVFYRDRSHLSVARRARVNFDHPRALDWASVRRALRCWTAGKPACVPVYDYATHSRRGSVEVPAPGRVLFVEGLWVLRPRWLRALYDFTVFVDCPQGTRLKRRMARDAVERGRSRAEVLRRFREQVEPMHRRFVEPQRRRAHAVVPSPVRRADLAGLVRQLQVLTSTAP